MWEKICCFLSQLVEFAYGEPTDSRSGDVILGATYTAVLTAPRSSCVVIRNTGLVNINYFPANVESATGGLLQPGDPMTIYNFRGTLFARGDTGTINFLVMPKW